MAGPSVVVRILGDLRGLGQSMAGAGTAAQSAASKAQAGFGKMLGTLNASGTLGPFGNALAGINDAIGSIITNGKKIGPALLGAGAGVAGVGALLSGLGSHEQAAHQQLSAAIDASGHDWSEYGKQIDGAIKKGEKYGKGAAETQNALQTLTQATHDPAKALTILNTAFDVSAAKHEDLSSAAGQLGKVYNGNTRLLKEFGVTVVKSGSAQAAVLKDTKLAESADTRYAAAKRRLNDLQTIDATKKKLSVSAAIALRNAQDKVNGAALTALGAHHRLAAAQDQVKNSANTGATAIGKVAAVTKGQASAAADTFGGKLNALKAKITDQVATFGQKYGPALQLAGVAIMAAGTIFEAGGALMATGEGLALGPILLIVAAVAGLILIGVLLYKNWDTIWGAIKKTISVVWDWIKNNWPLLLAIITGPIALAAYLIWKNFDKIKSLAADAVAFIKSIWDTIVGWFGGLVSRVGGVLSGLFDKAKSAATTVISDVKGYWDTFKTWLEGLPGQLVHTFDGMFNGITGAFRAAINALIDLWDAFPKIHIGGWKLGPFTAPSADVGLPHIDHLAQGGLITQSGLVFAHAGEAITPLPRGRLGPVLHIEHATFVEPVDLDVLTQRLGNLTRSRQV
jgi:hypothetical protein